MNKKTLFLALAAAGISALIACTHQPSHSSLANTENTTIAEKRTPASQEKLDQADMDRIRNIVLKKDSVFFKNFLVKLAEAQILVSSFDIRMIRILNENDMDRLFESNLYCKLWRVHGIHEHTEDQMAFAMRVAKLSNSSDWIYDQISAYAKIDVAREAAMANLFRGLADDEINICASKGCIAGDVTKLKNINVNPLDNAEFNRFMSKNKAAVAMYSQAKENDLKPGDCFTPDSSRKPQAEAYDWKNRNWIGSVLPAGQFVFTYDDGPHASYTRVIRDTWADAGMAKPAFFWLRQNASHLPDIVKELNEQGYVIGSHSERHADLGNLAKADSPDAFNGVNKTVFGAETRGLTGAAFASYKEKALDREINQSVADLSIILGKDVRYFRLPFGSGVRNDLIGSRFQALNLDHFFWRVDSLDWQDKNPESIRDRVVAQMKTVGKGIVLFHDIHPQSAQAAKLMVEFLKNSSTYKAVSIHDIPGLKP